MDKITKVINDWLLKYEKIKEYAEIHTEELPDCIETLSLQEQALKTCPCNT